MSSYADHDRLISKMNVAIGRLGEPCATILRDFYIGNLSMSEIAGKFGYSNPDNAIKNINAFKG
jgi:hypothetical protein